MLALTQQATDVIRGIVDAEEDAPAGAGLRIAAADSTEDSVDLDLSFVAGPEEGDDAVEENGVRVYLDAEAAALLDDKVLDAHEHDDHVHLELGERSS
jgi:Fe-S cluster assembly iron-binding protein IscA